MLHPNQSFPRKPSVMFLASTRMRPSYMRLVGYILHFFHRLTHCTPHTIEYTKKIRAASATFWAVELHDSVTRFCSNSPVPLPRKASSLKVTFDTEMQPESEVSFSCKEFTRRELTQRWWPAAYSGSSKNCILKKTALLYKFFLWSFPLCAERQTISKVR